MDVVEGADFVLEGEVVYMGHLRGLKLGHLLDVFVQSDALLGFLATRAVVLLHGEFLVALHVAFQDSRTLGRLGLRFTR
mgnify:CR=1 FL=1